MLKKLILGFSCFKNAIIDTSTSILPGRFSQIRYTYWRHLKSCYFQTKKPKLRKKNMFFLWNGHKTLKGPATDSDTSSKSRSSSNWTCIIFAVRNGHVFAIYLELTFNYECLKVTSWNVLKYLAIKGSAPFCRFMEFCKYFFAISGLRIEHNVY